MRMDEQLEWPKKISCKLPFKWIHSNKSESIREDIQTIVL